MNLPVLLALLFTLTLPRPLDDLALGTPVIPGEKIKRRGVGMGCGELRRFGQGWPRRGLRMLELQEMESVSG
ncbi:hypothetical protein BU16DRAFT_159701 [Lophium mytilinum]|uniref:Uncharacterized protein n=1 Tax=Lophium mytilinum TaxID=390894 RepID=A0A6A6QEP1_9PEZI|nr:hypothetical protein BU16DRAFT_159701 [Lophium mytilinum]